MMPLSKSVTIGPFVLSAVDKQQNW